MIKGIITVAAATVIVVVWAVGKVATDGLPVHDHD